jgi:hypothetical protein
MGHEIRGFNVLWDAAGVIHQHSQRDLMSVRDAIEPRFSADPFLDFAPEIKLTFVDQVHGNGGKESFPYASCEHAIARLHGCSGFEIRHASAACDQRSVGKHHGGCSTRKTILAAQALNPGIKSLSNFPGA